MASVSAWAAPSRHTHDQMTQVDCLFIEFGGVGGVAESTATLALTLHKQGNNVLVLSVSPSESRLVRWPVQLCSPVGFISHVTARPTFRRARHRGVRTMVTGLRWILLSAHIISATMRLAPRTRVISIQGRLFSPLVFGLTLMTRRGPAHTIVTPHNHFSRHDGLWRYLDDMFMRAAARVADFVVLHGPIDGVGVRRPTFRRVPRGALHGPNPVPVHTLVAIDSPVTRDSNRRPRLCTPGYIRRDKGVVEFAAAIADTSLDIIYDVVGVARDPGVVRELRAMDDERVHVDPLTQPLSSECFSRVLATADIIVLPYQVVTGSGVLESCLGLGVPVVSRPFSAALELQEAGAAVLVAADSAPGAILDACRIWLAMDKSEQRARLATGRALLRMRTKQAAAPYLRVLATSRWRH